MWHKIDNIASTHFLNTKTFKEFCLTEGKIFCDDDFIHGKDVNLVIAKYREAGFKERLIPSNDNT